MVASVSQDLINSVNANNASANSVTDTTNARATLGNNLNTFLTLLTAQLQNQDPLSPMDSNQFTQQLVQFSQVEQQITTNEKLDALTKQSQSAAAGTALAYLGRDAILQSSNTQLANGQANWAYNLSKDAQDVTLSVQDSSGHIVYSRDGDTTTGGHLFTWDGSLTSGGTAQNGGVYTLVVTAKDSANAAVNSTITTRETIMGVDFSSASPQVITASGAHDLSSVETILNAN